MGSLTAGVLNALGLPVGLVGDAPNVPSAPVEIGTPGVRQAVSETGSWQVLLGLFALVLVLGAVVLMYAVRQRTLVLRRRRVRRMGEVAALVAAMGGVAPAAAPAADSGAAPTAIPVIAPERPSPNA